MQEGSSQTSTSWSCFARSHAGILMRGDAVELDADEFAAESGDGEDRAIVAPPWMTVAG